MDEEKVYYTIILRHDTSTNWMMNNPILALSEYGVEDDTHRVKRGDGQSNWADLPYEHFGLEYLVTFENLIGDVTDNENLKTALDSKINNNIFSENANGVIENIILTDEEGTLAKITRVTKDVVLGSTRLAYLKVISKDNSIQGIYSIDDEGARVLNLQAYSHINDYEVGKTYHINELCYYDNRLYRAVHEEFVAEESFTKAHWVLLASLHSNDIKYNHLISGLEADTVKDAIDELTDLDSQKVKKTNRENKVYGTNEFGEQYLYNKDDLRKVDTVNHKQADLNKNVQVDASDINYTDTDPSKGTVRQVLDSKVDKTVAGAGAKIVRDVQFDYDVTTGHIILREDKFSLEDGASATEEREIDVVSEKELQDNVDAINDTINTKETALYNTINTKETEIYNTMNTKETALYETINTKETQLYNVINTKEDEIYNKILDEHNEINTRVTQEVATLNDRITSEVTTLNETIDTKEAALQEEIDTNTSEISRVETESKARDNNLNTQINNAVNTLNNTINYQIDIVNDRIDNEVETLNNTIDTKEQTINDRIDDEVADLNTRIDDEVQAMDDKKVNRAIANTLITEIVAATESQEPTLKITAKNTVTENATISHLHFRAQGQIQTRFQDADHIVIDSTQIDAKDTRQDERLTSIEGRLDGHDDDIADLYEHDATHDRTLGQHADLIQDLRHDVTDLQTEMTDAQYDIGRLQTQNATQETHLTNLDELVQANTEDIITANQNISRNLASITDLQNNKANKTFANLTNNKVVGTLNTQELQNNEIIRLGIKSIDPSTETASDSILKVISSDNTIIAVRDRDTGVIDLKANLDTDVNYFVTTEILSTTIPSENIIPLNTLTPTDKINVEVHDIISDPEGTWARVESINELTETCVAITFKKHAQAVWGTIKGDIADQQDLQEQFSDLETQLSGDITAEENARITADQALQDNIDNMYQELDNRIVNEGVARTDADTALQEAIEAEETARVNADNTKVDKVDTADKVYGTDSNGDQTTYDKNDFGKVDTVNNVTPDANKNVQLDASNINLDDTAQSPIALQTIINNLITDLQSQISVYTQNTSYTKVGTYTTQKYITFENNEGIVLMAKIMKNFTSDNNEPTVYESLIRDVENGNLKLIGIPEQVGPTPGPTPPEPTEYEETFDILNEVDGQSDTYEGLGGTEEEVEEILDNILGN